MSKLLNMETRHKLEVAGCEKSDMVAEEKQSGRFSPKVGFGVNKTTVNLCLLG
jgi:hypothetical protein